MPRPGNPEGPRPRVEVTGGSGDGWVVCACGHRHWGRFGAAGLLLHDGDRVLLQHRAAWSHVGGTWGVPGGARHRREVAREAALREASEEAGIRPGDVRPLGALIVDHGTWSYTTVVATPLAPVTARSTDAESEELRWVPAAEVTGLPLHPGFAETWPRLRAALVTPPLVVVVDGANVVGSRPDGWWRDRPGAAARLRDRLAALWELPVPAAILPRWEQSEALSGWYAEPVLVVEGAARAMPDAARGPAVVRAPDSGDDAVVAEVRRRAPDATVVVVTADRELAERCRQAGSGVMGPAVLLRLLDG